MTTIRINSDAQEGGIKGIRVSTDIDSTFKITEIVRTIYSDDGYNVVLAKKVTDFHVYDAEKLRYNYFLTKVL